MKKPLRLDYLKDRHLRLLKALADEGQLGRAAARVGISQPAASKALMEIEDRAGTQLFVRGPLSTLPTETGRILVDYAEHCLGATRRVTEELESVGERKQRILRAGMLASVAATLAPAAITELLIQHPHTEIALEEGVMDDLVEKLRRSEIDVIVGRIDSTAATEFAEIHLTEEPLAIVCRPEHLILQEATVTAAHIRLYPWILPLKRTVMREEVDQVLRIHIRDHPIAPIESNSPIAYIDLLRRSDRLAVMSRGVARKWSQAGLLSIVPLEIDFHPRAIGVMFRHDDAYLQAVSAFIQVLRSRCTWRE